VPSRKTQTAISLVYRIYSGDLQVLRPQTQSAFIMIVLKTTNLNEEKQTLTIWTTLTPMAAVRGRRKKGLRVKMS